MESLMSIVWTCKAYTIMSLSKVELAEVSLSLVSSAGFNVL